MRHTAVKPRRKFLNAGDEMNYRADQVLYWFYGRGDRARAAPFAERLRTLVVQEDPNCDSILGASYRALAAEVAGDLWTAIQSRQHEIELIRRLESLGPLDLPPVARLGPDALPDRLDLLALLYWDADQPQKALAILDESKRICVERSIPFDAEDVVAEIRAKMDGAEPRNGTDAPVKRRKRQRR